MRSKRAFCSLLEFVWTRPTPDAADGNEHSHDDLVPGWNTFDFFGQYVHLQLALFQ